MQPSEKSYGIVLVHRADGLDRFLLVLQRSGNWSFPKGHPEEGETPLQTARRELEEECGIQDVSFVPDVVFSEDYTFMRAGIETEKHNDYFLGFTRDTEVRPQPEEILECRFATYEEAVALFRFANAKRVLESARAALQKISH